MKILIVDDHAQARASLMLHCQRSDDVQVIGEATFGKAAIGAAGTLNPDILLLDLELPDMSGFELLRAIAADTRPLGIMVSTCPDHAIKAFAEGALDYLVTPATAERFDQAIARARYRVNMPRRHVHAPGAYNAVQQAGWRKITNAAHAAGGSRVAVSTRHTA